MAANHEKINIHYPKRKCKQKKSAYQISYALSQTMTKKLALGTIESGIEIITFEQVIQVIDDYMHYHNNERRQWNKIKMTPVEYRKFLLVS